MDMPSLETLAKLLNARDMQRRGELTPAQEALHKVVELLLSGCPIVVHADAPPGMAYAIDSEETVLGLPPQRIVVFHSESERDAFLAAFRKWTRPSGPTAA